MKVLIILAIIVYFVGMFITKIVITVYDNSVSAIKMIDDFDIVFMIIWPIFLPIIGVYVLFRKLYETAEDIGNEISMKLRDKGNGR